MGSKNVLSVTVYYSSGKLILYVVNLGTNQCALFILEQMIIGGYTLFLLKAFMEAFELAQHDPTVWDPWRLGFSSLLLFCFLRWVLTPTAKWAIQNLAWRQCVTTVLNVFIKCLPVLSGLMLILSIRVFWKIRHWSWAHTVSVCAKFTLWLWGLFRPFLRVVTLCLAAATMHRLSPNQKNLLIYSYDLETLEFLNEGQGPLSTRIGQLRLKYATWYKLWQQRAASIEHIWDMFPDPCHGM